MFFSLYDIKMNNVVNFIAQEANKKEQKYHYYITKYTYTLQKNKVNQIKQNHTDLKVRNEVY